MRSLLMYCTVILFGGPAYGEAVKSFNIKGASIRTGKTIEIQSKNSKKALVVIFVSPRCPCSISHEPHLKDLYRKYSELGFHFLGIYSNVNKDLEQAKAHFDMADLPFEVIADPSAALADMFQALSTPHVFVISPGGEFLYVGGATDSSQFSESEKHYLENALKNISQGSMPAVRKTRALGCMIDRP